MLRSIRHAGIVSHHRYITPAPHGINNVTNSIGILDQCIRQYLSRMSCFWDVLLPQLFHLKMPHNVIIRTLIMWGPCSGHEPGYWRLIYHSDSDNNHHYHLLTRNKLRTVSRYLCKCANHFKREYYDGWLCHSVSLCPREHRAGHIASALSIIFKTSDVCWSRVSCQAWDLLWTKYL